MAYENEKRFVKLFVKKGRKQRLLYLLTDPQKRYAGLERFCHEAEELLDGKKLLMRGDDLTRRPEFIRFIAERNEPCLVLSPSLQTEGIRLFAVDAVGFAERCCDAVLAIGGTFALVFGEPEKGGRQKYLLSAE